MFTKLFDDERESLRRDGEVVGFHEFDGLPHGLVAFVVGEGQDELFEFEGGGGVVGTGAGPGEEAEGFGRVSAVAGAEDAVDEL